MKPARVVVFSPNPYSLYTTTVCELLRQRGIEVCAIFVRRFTWRRFRHEFARDGHRLLRKIWTKLVLREQAYAADGGPSILTFRRAHGITVRSVAELHARHGMEVISCATLNDAIVEAKLRELRPDLVVFTGGGIIRAPILAAAGAGVVNCHSGILPDYRGMDVVEWAVLAGQRKKIGCTVHFMDQGLDTGDILCVDTVAVEPGDTIPRIRQKIEARMPEVLVEAVAGFLEGKVQRAPQKIEAGHQYFIMHPALRAAADKRLAGFAVNNARTST